jgi:hypothetical protein
MNVYIIPNPLLVKPTPRQHFVPLVYCSATPLGGMRDFDDEFRLIQPNRLL